MRILWDGYDPIENRVIGDQLLIKKKCIRMGF